jgi:hypothetical protein
MKRKTIALISIIGVLLTACGGARSYQTESTNDVLFDQFVVVEDREYNVIRDNWYDFYIVYDKDTKVMYYFANGYDRAMLSPVYNSDGTVKVWEEK